MFASDKRLVCDDLEALAMDNQCILKPNAALRSLTGSTHPSAP